MVLNFFLYAISRRKFDTKIRKRATRSKASENSYRRLIIRWKSNKMFAIADEILFTRRPTLQSCRLPVVACYYGDRQGAGFQHSPCTLQTGTSVSPRNHLTLALVARVFLGTLRSMFSSFSFSYVVSTTKLQTRFESRLTSVRCQARMVKSK